MNFGSTMSITGPVAVNKLTAKAREDGRYTHRLQLGIYMDNGQKGDYRKSQMVTGFCSITDDSKEAPAWLQLLAKETYKGRSVSIVMSNLSTGTYNLEGNQLVNVNFNFRSQDVSAFGPGADKVNQSGGVSQQETPPEGAPTADDNPPF